MNTENKNNSLEVSNENQEVKLTQILNQEFKTKQNVFFKKMECVEGQEIKALYLGTATIENEDGTSWLCHEFAVMENKKLVKCYQSGSTFNNAYRLGRLLTNQVYSIVYLGKFESVNNKGGYYHKYEISLLS